MNKNTISLVIADDQILFLDLLRNIVESRAGDFRIVGTAFNGNDAVDIILQKKPDIALLDIRMPGIDGVEVTKQIRTSLPEVKVIILTTFPDDEYVEKAMAYGASGYLLNNMPVDELIASIRSIYGGNFIVSEQIAKKVFKKARSSSSSIDENVKLSNRQKELTKYLSRREREVYELMVQGYSNHEIADILFIAKQTVKNHIHSIYSKIGFHNRSGIYNLHT